MENSQELSQSRLSGIPSIMYTFRVLIKYVGGLLLAQYLKHRIL